jgi:hypothetical protein
VALLVLLILAPAGHAGTTVAITPADRPELFLQGDFDGDGRSDLVVVDKETGDYRMGYQLSPGTHTWVRTRASGVDQVTEASAGKLISTVRDSLVLTSPEANRINVLDAPDPNTAGLPLSFHPSTIGPNLVVAIDVGGLGNTPHDDLFMASRWNNGPANLFGLVRNNAGTMSELGAFVLSAPLELGSRVTLKTGIPVVAGAILRDPANTFVAWDVSSVSPSLVTSLPGLPAGVDYVWGQFNVASLLSQFAFYVPGQSNLLIRPVEDPALSFGPGFDAALGDAIAQAFTLPGSAPRLLVLFGARTRAVVYDFDGVNPPTVRQEFNATAGEVFTGAGMLGGGNFTMYSSRDGSARSTSFQTYNFNGSAFVAGQTGNLPAVTALTAPANVLLFQFEPFVVNNVNLLRSLNAGDWSSQLGTLPGPVSVQAETFGGSGPGLGNATATPLGSSPPLAAFGLVNQYSNFFSLFSLNPAQGDAVSDVRIDPNPGLYKKGLVIAFTAADPSHQIFYRLGQADPWTLYLSGTPVRLFKATTVQFYGKPPLGTAKSRIKSATYTFTDPPSSLDSNGDGVPDYVAIAKGLDPLRRGNDTDGDGYPDLDELLAGTDPLNEASHPAGTLERHSVFDIVATPRPWDGTVPGVSLSVTGTAVRAFDLTGSLIAYARTTNTGLIGVLDPAAKLRDIPLEPTQRLLALATEENFALQTSGTDPRLGRELLQLLPVPDLRPALQVQYPYGGGPLLTEANAWLAAAAASNALTSRTLIQTELGINDTLIGLLMEQKVREALLARNVTQAVNLTLFGFRPTDANRYHPDADTLLSIESRGPTNQPAYLLRTLQATLQGLATTSAVPAVVDLRQLTAEIYRLSSASNNAAPGTYPSPVDTLRDFIASGSLPSSYLAQIALTPLQQANAFAGVAALLNAVEPRPVTSLELRIRADSFTGPCTVLETTGLSPTPVALFHPGGEPYRLLEAFQLLPGTRVQVLGYSDVESPLCAGPGLEVISLQLGFVPAPVPTDLNGNLLPDEWEALFGVSDPFADSDGDGYSNLQELFDGTDPRDGLSKSGSPPADLSPPTITVDSLGGGLLKLSWDWPEPFASKVKFHVMGTSDLGTPFADLGLSPSKTGGHFELTLPNPGGSGATFFHLIITL